MKLKRDDTVMVMAGRDKGKTGKVTAVIPAKNQVLVENINIAKRHTKPSDKHPRGGIIEIVKPIDASKVMVLDPATGLPARVGYQINADGTKERIFKVGKQRQAAKPKKTEGKAPVATEDKPAAVAKPKAAPKAPAKKSEGESK